MANLTELVTKLCQQENSLREYLQRTKDTSIRSKERVQLLFSELRELLSNKELEIIRTIDAKTSEVTGAVEECLVKTAVNIGISQNIAEVISQESCDRTSNDIQLCLDRGEAVMTSNVVSYAINESVKYDIANIQYGHFNDYISGDRGTSTHNDQFSAVSHYPENVASNLVPEGATKGQNTQQMNTHIHGDTRANMSKVLPSAPPPPPQSAVGEDQPPPPSYWQAVSEPPFSGTSSAGSRSLLEGPAYSQTRHAFGHPAVEGTESVSWMNIPDKTSPCWQLKEYHTVNVCYENPISTQIIPVALCSHNELICLADKNNLCLTFFTVDGVYLGARVFNTPPYDVQFFGDDGDTPEFIATFPLENQLKIIYFKEGLIKIRAITHEPSAKHQYTSICKGPTGVPYLGASTLKRPCKVRTFDNRCELVDFINNDIYFPCPRSCLSYKSNVIVSDWDLGLVCIFTTNGESIGRYTGTPLNPLVNPVDMTLDSKGHVYVLSGCTSTVHIVDQFCNFMHALKVPESGKDEPRLVEYLARTNMLAIVRESGKKMELFQFSFEP